MTRRQAWLLLATFATLILCQSLRVFAEPAPPKRAVLIGINRYKFLKPEEQLSGSVSDVHLMKVLLQGFGFAQSDVKSLLEDQARSALIRSAMNWAAVGMKPGGVAVLYFSGRGSVITTGSRKGEPTLLASDAARAYSQAEITMTEIEQWSKSVADRGARPYVILDTCFVNRAKGEEVESRYCDPRPRTIDRPGVGAVTVRNYKGLGLCLQACGSEGRAYEWEYTFGSRRGVFTDTLVNDVSRRRKKGERLDAETVFQSVRRLVAGWSKRGSIGGGQIPVAHAQSGIKDPLFMVSAQAPVPASAIPEMDRIIREQREYERELSVGLDIVHAPGDRDAREATRKQVRAALEPALRRHFEQNMEGVVLRDRFGKVDRILAVNVLPDNTMTLTIRGDEVNEAYKTEYILPTLSEADIRDLLKDGPGTLTEALRYQALVVRLFRLAGWEADANLPVDWAASPGKPEYRLKRNGESPDYVQFIINVKSPLKARLYLLDCDEDGVEQLIWPLAGDSNNRVRTGKVTIPHPGTINLEISGTTPLGVNTTRVVLVEEPDEAEFPPLEPPDGRKEWQVIEYRPFQSRMHDHLRYLIKEIEAGRLRWTSKTISYRVVP